MSEIENFLFKEGMVKEKTVEDESWLDEAMTEYAMSREFSKSRPWVKKCVKKLVKISPELNGKKAVKNGKIVFYYPKELVDIIKRISEGEKDDMAPEGWFTLNKIASILPRNKEWIKYRIPLIMERYPDLEVKRFNLKKIDRLHTHYSPEFVKKIEELIQEEEQEYEQPKKGEMTERGLCSMLGRNKRWVNKHIEEAIGEDPNLIGEWCKELGRTPRFYYPKELADKLREISLKQGPIQRGRPPKSRV